MIPQNSTQAYKQLIAQLNREYSKLCPRRLQETMADFKRLPNHNKNAKAKVEVFNPFWLEKIKCKKCNRPIVIRSGSRDPWHDICDQCVTREQRLEKYGFSYEIQA